MMRRVAIAAVLCGACCLSNAGWRVDGETWRKHSDYARVALVQGYVEGYSQAQIIAPFSICTTLSNSSECFNKGTDAAAKMMNSFDGVTYGQIRDGIDSFYGDYRNRKIELPGAMTYVLRAIRGTPAAELETFVEGLRQFAGKQ